MACRSRASSDWPTPLQRPRRTSKRRKPRRKRHRPRLRRSKPPRRLRQRLKPSPKRSPLRHRPRPRPKPSLRPKPKPNPRQRPKPSRRHPKLKQRAKPKARQRAPANLPRARSRRRASDMEVQVTTLDGKKAGSVTLSDAIFGLEPRADIIHRCVVWQLAKRQRGTHEVKNRAEITRTGKKMYRQKGTGSARHGSARVNLFRGGGRSFGPHTRSHAIGLPKKVRALALKHALSAKAKDGGILVIEALSVKEAKTKALRGHFDKLGLSNALFIDGAELAADVRKAARNIPNVDVLPVAGINVYDIMRRNKLVLTRAALDALEARFK